MKVAITCDHILERRPVHRLVELACSMYPQAVVYTLAHEPGKVLGPIEMHSIRSSFMSNFVKNEKEFFQKSYLIPVAAKKLEVPCSFDLIINFSGGFSHGIAHCKKSSVLNYYFSNGLNRANQTFLEKIFNKYLTAWAKKMIDTSSHKVQSNESFMPGLKVLRPFFNFEDFIFHDTEPRGNIALINKGNLSFNDVKRLSDTLSDQKYRVIILGDDIGITRAEYLKNTCSGELTPLFKEAEVIVEGNDTEFPEFALSSYASGRNIWVKKSVTAVNYLGSDLPNFFESIEDIASSRSVANFKRQKYRDHAARYSQLLFKTGLMRQLRDMGYIYRPQK